jgi:hypothetical protein
MHEATYQALVAGIELIELRLEKTSRSNDSQMTLLP